MPNSIAFAKTWRDGRVPCRAGVGERVARKGGWPPVCRRFGIGAPRSAWVGAGVVKFRYELSRFKRFLLWSSALCFGR